MVIRRGQCSSCPLIFDKFVDLRKHEISAHSIKFPQVNTGLKRPKKVKGGAGEVAEDHVMSPDPSRSPRKVMAQKRRKKGSNVKPKGKTGGLDNLAKKKSKQSTNSRATREERPDELAFRERVENYDWTRDWIKFKTRRGLVAYKCKTCSMVFIKFGKMHALLHSFVHSGETPFECAYCPSKFKRINDRMSHERIHTGDTPYRCSICSSTFKHSGNWHRHISKHATDPNFKPNPRRNKISGVKNPSNKNSGLKKPSNDHGVKDGPKFDVTKEFDLESSRTGRGLQCKAIVSKSDSDSLKNHFENHHAKSPNKIIPESKISIRQRISNSRKRTTNGDRPDELAFRERVQNYDWTRDWIKFKTQEGLVAYKCKECSVVIKKFSKGIALSHSFVHSGETPFQCAHCPSKFKRVYDRISHERIHTGETPFRCSICSSTFKHSAIWHRHMSKHATDPNFLDVCSDLKETKRPDEVVFEERVRNYDCTQDWIKTQGERTLVYKCKECSMVLKYFSKSKALCHTFIHSGESPFKCAYCPAKFNQIVNRIRHERIHSGETPYRCSKCPLTFNDAGNWRKHVSKHATNPNFKSNPRKNKLSGIKPPSNKIKNSGLKKATNDLGVKDGSKFDVTKEFVVESSRAGRYRCLQCKTIVWKSDPESLRTHFESHPAKSTSKITPESKLSISHPEDSRIYERIRNYDWSNDWKKIKIGTKEVFKCSKCKTTTPDPSDLLLHTFIHTGELPFKCISCPMKFRLASTRKEHEGKHFKNPQLELIRVENDSSLTKTYPELVFKGISIGKKETGAFEDLGSGIQSEVEGFKTEKSKILKNVEKKSIRIERKKKPNYTSKRWLKIKKDPVKRKFNWTTIESKANSNSLKCSSCGKIASSREAMRDHEDTHYGMRRYKCWICSKRFQLKSIFSKHLESHERNCTKNSNDISVPEPNCNLSTEMGFSENELEELGTILNKWQKN